MQTRFISSVLPVTILFSLAACASETDLDVEATDSVASAAIVDVASMTRRADGRYDVTCRDGRSQVVTADELSAGNVCVPVIVSPPTGRVVALTNRSIGLPHGAVDTEVEQWGRGLWDGYVSFDAYLSGPEAGGADNAALVDATGARYALTTAVTRFARLPMPVRLLARTDGSIPAFVTIQSGHIEVTRTHDIPATSNVGRFPGTTRTDVLRFGSDIPGTRVSFLADASFARNYTNGNECARLEVAGQDGVKAQLVPSASRVRVEALAPIVIRTNASCISSPLAAPEDAAKDYQVSVTSITVGDPVR